MSYIASRPEQSTDAEVTALQNLASLAASGSSEFIRKTSATEFENSLSGAGDMSISTYDAAGVLEQLVGLTATQTLSNKTFTELTVIGTLSVLGSLDFGDASTDILTITGYIRGAVSGLTYISLGTGTPGNLGTPQIDDVFIKGRLEVDGNLYADGKIYASAIERVTGGALNITLGSAAGDDFIIDTTGFVYEGDTNRVGIGTATPAEKLEVNGIVRVNGSIYSYAATPLLQALVNTADGPRIIMDVSGGVGRLYTTRNSGVVQALTFGIDTVEKMRVATNGNVGIGTATPVQMLNLKNGHIRLDQVSAPSAATVAVGAAGVLTGNYYYRITFVTALGETETGTASAVVAPSSQQVNLSAIPISSDTAVTSRKIYRTTAGGSQILMQLVATIADNTTTTYSDNIADGSLGVAESRVNTTGGVIYNGTTRAGIIDNSATAIGMNALRVNTGYYNSAMGINSLFANTTGNYNSAMGQNSLLANTTGSFNSAMGLYALASNTAGNYNSAMGMYTLYSNITGSYNSAMGRDTFRSNTTGNYNSFFGYAAGYHANQKVDAVNSMGLGANTWTTASNQIVIGDTSITETLLKRAGTAKANADILTLENTGNAADMDGTQTSILFNQFYYDATTPAVADAGRITVGTETDWTSTAATQDSYMSFRTALDGVITEQARVDSSVTAGQTRFLIYDVDNATLERVTVGAADSGGSGFKLLRIAN